MGLAPTDPIERLVECLGRLPGVGQKTAYRLAYFLLRSDASFSTELASALVDVKTRIRFCSICCNLTEPDPCAICANPRRNHGLVCVVAQSSDVLAIERAGFEGTYHVLHGLLSPLDGVGPDELRIRELLARCQATGRDSDAATPGEVILATSPHVEGEATAAYLAKLLRPLGVRTTRIATGIPMGGELEYADRTTLRRALDSRRDI